MLKTREMAYLAPTKGLFAAKPRHGHAVYTLQVHPQSLRLPPSVLMQDISLKDIGYVIMTLKVS